MLGGRGKSIQMEQTEDELLEENADKRPWYRRAVTCFRRSSEQHSGASYFFAASSAAASATYPHHEIDEQQIINSLSAEHIRQSLQANPHSYRRMCLHASRAVTYSHLPTRYRAFIARPFHAHIRTHTHTLFFIPVHTFAYIYIYIYVCIHRFPSHSLPDTSTSRLSHRITIVYYTISSTSNI